MAVVRHLVPYDGIGGVELAARTMRGISRGPVDYDVQFIFEGVSSARERLATFNPAPLLRAAWRLSRRDVDVLVVSLWRSAAVGLLAKLLRPRLDLVLFLHSSRDAHVLDRLVTRLAARVATEVWADSRATLRTRIPGLAPGRSRVISVLTSRFDPAPERPVTPSFIFWGRLAAVKGLERALRLFARIRERAPGARFVVVGPDGGERASLERVRASLGLADAVTFEGPATHERIAALARDASFYLQTSVYEGMAMSVVEAMQLGLVPVVTPVGEIASYCRDGHNAVLVGADDEPAVQSVLGLLAAGDRYAALRAGAVATWRDRPLYRDSVLSACEALLARPAERA